MSLNPHWTAATTIALHSPTAVVVATSTRMAKVAVALSPVALPICHQIRKRSARIEVGSV